MSNLFEVVEWSGVGGRPGGKFEQLICNVSKFCSASLSSCLKLSLTANFDENEFQIKVETFTNHET